MGPTHAGIDLRDPTARTMPQRVRWDATQMGAGHRAGTELPADFTPKTIQTLYARDWVAPTVKASGSTRTSTKATRPMTGPTTAKPSMTRVAHAGCNLDGARWSPPHHHGHRRWPRSRPRDGLHGSKAKDGPFQPDRSTNLPVHGTLCADSDVAVDHTTGRPSLNSR